MMKRTTGQLARQGLAVGLLSVALLALPLAPKAAAALALKYDPPKASPGTVVSAETVRRSGILFQETPRLFLARVEIADKIRALTDPRLNPIGELGFDEDGIGRITFTVPDVAAGSYIAVVAADDRGAITAPKPLRVTAVDSEGGPSDSGTGDGGLPTGVLIAFVGAGILLAGAAVALVTSRRRHRASPLR